MVFFLRKAIASISKNDFTDLIEIIIGLEGTMLGFIITAVSILVAFNGSRLTEEVKQTGHFRTVLVVYLVTCFELFLLIAFSVYMLISNVINIVCMNLFMIMLIASAFYILLCLVFLCLIVYTLFH